MSTLTIHARSKPAAAGASDVSLELAGSLDNSTVACFEAHLRPVLAAQPPHLILDLAELKFVTSAGIRLFLVAAKQQKQHGGHIAFVNLQPQIKAVFAIMGSIAEMRIFKDQAELDAYLIARQRTFQP